MPILEHVIRRAHHAGIDRFVIVVGYCSDLIRSWFDGRSLGVSVTFVENPDYHKSNGISALKAKPEIRGNFLLLMADHIFEPQTARVLLRQQPGPGEVILAVDPGIDRIFDLDDATKVRREGGPYRGYRKGNRARRCPGYRNVPCSPALFERLESATKDGNCSLSDGMRQLAAERRLRALEIGEGQWQDLDTPEALAYAEGIFDGYFHPDQILEGLARVCRTIARTRLPLRLLAGLFGRFAVRYLVHRAGPAKLVASIATMRWGLALAQSSGWSGPSSEDVGMAAHLAQRKTPGLLRAYVLGATARLRSLVGQLGGLGQLFGDGLRVSMLGPGMPLASGISSVTIDRASSVLSAAVVSIAGLWLGTDRVASAPRAGGLREPVRIHSTRGSFPDCICSQNTLARAFRDGTDHRPGPVLQRLDRTQGLADPLSRGESARLLPPHTGLVLG